MKLKDATGFRRLEFWEESGAKDKLGTISTWIVFKSMKPDEIISGISGSEYRQKEEGVQGLSPEKLT